MCLITSLEYLLLMIYCQKWKKFIPFFYKSQILKEQSSDDEKRRLFFI